MKPVPATLAGDADSWATHQQVLVLLNAAMTTPCWSVEAAASKEAMLSWLDPALGAVPAACHENSGAAVVTAARIPERCV